MSTLIFGEAVFFKFTLEIGKKIVTSTKLVE
jgi:hypothetical protein